MKIVNISELTSVGQPLYDMRKMFNISGDLTNVELNMITMPPGVRVPVEGTGFHDADEYSVFIDGEMYTESGNDKSIVKKGMATLIPKGEKHWCINKTDKPCTLLCMMVK